MPGSAGAVTLLAGQLRAGNQEAAIQLAMIVKRLAQLTTSEMQRRIPRPALQTQPYLRTSVRSG